MTAIPKFGETPHAGETPRVREKRDRVKERALRDTPRPSQPTAPQTVEEQLAAGVRLEAIRDNLLKQLDAVNDLIGDITSAPQQLAAERAKRHEIEAQLANVEDRRKPTYAYQDARARYEVALAALQREQKDDELHDTGLDDEERKHLQRDNHRVRREDLVEQVRFWRERVTQHGMRVAEEQVPHDLNALDIDECRQQLESRYHALQEREHVYDDDAPELLDMALIKQKLRVFDRILEDPKYQRRLSVERERKILRRSSQRALRLIETLQHERKQLNWFNPFHWKRIVHLDTRIAQTRSELDYTQAKYTILTTNPPEEVMPPTEPRTEVIGRRE